MAQITLGGNPVNTVGDLPAVGTAAPAFTLTGGDFGAVSSSDLAGQRIVLNIFPSLDTGVCQASIRAFNEAAADLDNTVIVCASADLPPAAVRFLESDGIGNVVTGSTFRNPEFADAYGVRMTDGKLEGLTARAVVVIDTDGTVLQPRARARDRPGTRLRRRARRARLTGARRRHLGPPGSAPRRQGLVVDPQNPPGAADRQDRAGRPDRQDRAGAADREHRAGRSDRQE